MPGVGWKARSRGESKSDAMIVTSKSLNDVDEWSPPSSGTHCSAQGGRVDDISNGHDCVSTA